MVSTVPKSEDGTVMTMGFEIHEAFGRGLDLVVDLGEPLPGTDSTVLRWVEGEMEVLREGAGSLEGL
jgi:tRNA A37 threonylcarbamoyladenosine synthetase subunit TsaC/SUA5/YrdC